jgi:F-type H+-transporting ATPase subunit b
MMNLFAVLILEGGLLSPNPGLIFWTFLTFLILLFVLRATAWKPIMSALDEREKTIQDAIDRAVQAKVESEQILAENKATLAKAEREADRIIQESKLAAEKLRTDINEKAKTESRKMLDDAKAEITVEKQRALAALRDEVAELAVKGAEMIIRHNLNAEAHKNIIAGVLNEMPSMQREAIEK